MKKSVLAVAIALASSASMAAEVSRAEFDQLLKRITALEQENQALKQAVQLKKNNSNDVAQQVAAAQPDLVGVNAQYSYKMLDHAEKTNTKQLYQLEAKRDKVLQSSLTLGGQITGLVNVQQANEDSKFGWLMRHPTSSNQIGEDASEAVVHAANLQMTALLSDDFTAYLEFLYNPEQNFGAGSTITGLPRNNLSVQRAYVLWGNLDKTPLYASLGKMDIPFGLNDTVSPFTNSTNWHSFAGLAYGATLGYNADNWHIRAMAIQGGAQFRNANTPVDGTNVPSRLNNFALDLNYQFSLAQDAALLVGASYQYGSAYCQGYVDTPQTAHSTFPAFIPGVTVNIAPQGVQHFKACDDNNPAVALYTQYQSNKLMLIGEYAKTLDDWAGTFNPYMPQFAASDNTTFTLGARYATDVGLPQAVDFSVEFSRFEAGASGSPWQKQDQFVVGASYFVTPGINLFAEGIVVNGWVPLNFLSGGNPGSLVGTSWSSQSSETKVLALGIQAGF